MSDQPKLVVNSASITSGIKAAVTVLTWLGFNSAAVHLDTLTTSIVAVALVLYEVVPHVLAAMHTQSKTTPVDTPRAKDGTPLGRVEPVAVASAAVPDVAAAPDVVDVEPMTD